jgi:pyruvate dehydrogenase E1 component alpha subunit
MTKRAEAYGMASMAVDGQEVEVVYETARKALKHARDGKGPIFVVADCVRLSGHYVGDPQVYRPKEEILDLRKARDPIELLRARLELPDEEFQELNREATRIAEDSVEFAKKGTDPKPEDALKNVYA